MSKSFWDISPLSLAIVDWVPYNYSVRYKLTYGIFTYWVCICRWHCICSLWVYVYDRELLSQFCVWVMTNMLIHSHSPTVTQSVLKDLLESLSEEAWWRFSKMTDESDFSLTVSLTCNSEPFWGHLPLYSHSRNPEWPRLSGQVLSQSVLIWNRQCSQFKIERVEILGDDSTDNWPISTLCLGISSCRRDIYDRSH